MQATTIPGIVKRRRLSVTERIRETTNIACLAIVHHSVPKPPVVVYAEGDVWKTGGSHHCLFVAGLARQREQRRINLSSSGTGKQDYLQE